jgi:hypothetical protein
MAKRHALLHGDLARAVGADWRVDLARADGAVEPVENRTAIHLEARIANVARRTDHDDRATSPVLPHRRCP